MLGNVVLSSFLATGAAPAAWKEALSLGACMESAVSLRACRPEDCAQVMRLIQELAEFEKVPEQVKINHQGLCKDGFCEDPFYKCLVAEVQPEDPSKGHSIVGYALYFFTYSTWKGRNIYLEDLYVMPEYRGKGIGKKLISKVAQAGVDKGCTQMKFSVLDWNRPAIDFYRGKGAVDLTATEGWHVFRFEGDALRQLALGEPGE